MHYFPSKFQPFFHFESLGDKDDALIRKKVHKMHSHQCEKNKNYTLNNEKK